MSRKPIATRAALNSERDELTHLLAAALWDLPPSRWLLPDSGLRRARFTTYARIWVDHGLANGTVDVAEVPDGALAGMTIWWPEPGPEPLNYLQELTNAVGRDQVPRFTAFDAAMLDVHPQENHLYLAFAAVDPDRHGRGYGTALLRRRHSALDASGSPAYLVAASSRSRHLYLRHGYQDCRAPISLSNGPTMYPMWREPAINAVRTSPLETASSRWRT